MGEQGGGGRRERVGLQAAIIKGRENFTLEQSFPVSEQQKCLFEQRLHYNPPEYDLCTVYHAGVTK